MSPAEEPVVKGQERRDKDKRHKTQDSEGAADGNRRKLLSTCSAREGENMAEAVRLRAAAETRGGGRGSPTEKRFLEGETATSAGYPKPSPSFSSSS